MYHFLMKFRHTVCVAPMMDITDKHCRFLLRLLAKDVFLYTEMLHASAIIYGDRDGLLGYNEIEHPIGLQIGGNDPNTLYKASKIASGYSYDEINLNCGCPSSRVLAGNFGVSLMQFPGLVADCIKAMQDASGVAVTVKHRIGLDNNEDYSFVRDFVGILSENGCKLFFVHARKALSKMSPKKNRDVPPIKMDVVRQLKTDFPHCFFVANGEINSIFGCATILNKSNTSSLPPADGVMLGRAVSKKPELLTELQKNFLNEKWKPRSPEKLIVELESYFQEQVAVGIDRRRIVRTWTGLFGNQKGSKRWRKSLADGVSPLTAYQNSFNF